MEMGTKSLQAATPARRRSFNLPGFRRSSAPERQEVLKNADEMPGGPSEEVARTQKAAAWQWFTRGVGEGVVLTPTRPPVGNAQAPVRDDKRCIAGNGPRRKDSQANVCDSNMPQKRIVKPPLAESHTAASRFKALLSTKNSSQISDFAPAVYEPAEMLYNDAYSTTEYHHHHYIHHHHHHYHFPKSPEEQASIVLSRRRHSESGSSRPCTPSLVEADLDEDEDEAEAEESRIAAYLAQIRRRRHSDSFPKFQLRPENAAFDNDVGMKEAESPKVGLPMQFSRRYNSERFLPSKTPAMGGKDNTAQPVEDEFDKGTFAGIRRRRRLSAELHGEEPSLERTGGKSEGGAYKLGGAGAGSGTPASMRMGRRRHSESSTVRPEAGAKATPSPGRPYRISPSARYYVDLHERQIGVPTIANAATAGFHAA